MKIKATYEYPCGIKESVIWNYWYGIGHTKSSRGKCPIHKYKCSDVYIARGG